MKINNISHLYNKNSITFSQKQNTENVIYSSKKDKKDSYKSNSRNRNYSFWSDVKEFFEVLFDKEVITHSSSKRKKIRTLTEADVPFFYAKQIANMDRKDFEQVTDLIMLGMEPTCIEESKELDEEQYAQAKDILLYREITDKDLISLSRLKKEKFEEAIDLLDYGVEKECVVAYSNCTKKEKRDIKSLLDKGEKPKEAILLRKRPLQQDIKNFFIELMETGLPTPIVESLITQCDLHEKAKTLFNEGINEDLLEDFAKLTPEEEEKCKELREIGLDDIDVIELCTLPDEDYSRAKKLIEEDVHSNFVLPILYIENEENENKEYRNLLKKGFGKNSAFSISCFTPKEREIFKKFVKTQPIIRNYLKNNYEINCINLQQQEANEISFTKEFYRDGTKITLEDTLNSNGELKQYRNEKYKDGTILTSIKAGKKSALITRDKKKGITAITEYLKDRNGAVYGVLHSEKSKELSGAFNTTYYDINDFICDTNFENINANINTSTLSKGIELSKATQKEDGSIEYNENYTNNGFKTKRYYKENKNGTEKEYSYTITDKAGKEILSINNSWKKNPNNTVTNIINGNEYLIKYDDKEKEITIEGENGERTICLYKKLAKYPRERIWEIAKTLDVDTLIKIDEEVTKWKYCEDVNSGYTMFNRTLESGANTNVITHETGHINAYNLKNTSSFEEIKQSYLKEMNAFEEKNTYIEQEIIEYFSPRAENEESDGFSEFIAETNLLLHSFGNKSNLRTLSIRSQILAKNFPETIAKIAEATGKNSKRPLV